MTRHQRNSRTIFYLTFFCFYLSLNEFELSLAQEEEYFSIGRCEGGCKGSDLNCDIGLSCFKRTKRQLVPGCEEESEAGAKGEDFCYVPPKGVLVYAGDDYDGKYIPKDAFPLGECQGDCDDDTECKGSLKCFSRKEVEPVPGCLGEGVEGTDYCFDESNMPPETPTEAPAEKPSKKTEAPTKEPSEKETESPTKEPSEKKTEAPTKEPSNKKTEAPAEKPSEKTEAPTEFGSTKLTSVDDETQAPYYMCEGDCKGNDAFCGDGLSCFSRTRRESVPGCEGKGEKGHSYCYTPPPGVLVFSSLNKEVLGKCEGNCLDDDMCDKGLECLLRKDEEGVPGCEGKGIAKMGYCYDPKDDSSLPAPTETEQPTAAPKPKETPAPSETTEETSEPESTPSLKIEDKNGKTILGLCQGDCFKKDNLCEEGLLCFGRDEKEAVPGCDGRGTRGVSYCYDPSTSTPESTSTSEPTASPVTEAPTTSAPSVTSQPGGGSLRPTSSPSSTPPSASPGTTKPTTVPILEDVDDAPMLSLEMCQGPCGGDDLFCGFGLSCYTRIALEEVPGCLGDGTPGHNYCYSPQEGVLVYTADDFDTDKFPLGECQADCDEDTDCAEGLICFFREDMESVPGCKGRGVAGRDYCHDPNKAGPTDAPISESAFSSASRFLQWSRIRFTIWLLACSSVGLSWTI